MNKLTSIFFLFHLLLNLLQAESIPLIKRGGVYYVPVSINDSIKLRFIVDSGASSVFLPYDVFRTLLRSGSITEKDILGEKTYVVANGDKEKSLEINLREIQVGKQVLYNVLASVGSGMEGELLLGQSALRKLEPWRIDSKKHIFYIKEMPDDKDFKERLANALDKLDEEVKKDVKGAISKCYDGVSSRCNIAGNMYLKGQYVKKDYNQAIKFFTLACNDNDYAGCYNLGSMYHEGTGVKKDIKKALKYYNKSCNNYNYRGCHNIALIYHDGKGIKQNYKKAIYYYKKACDAGIAKSCNNLAILYAKGLGTKKNMKRAKDLYEKACESNDYSSFGACVQLGIMYDDGKIVEKNEYKALKLYKKACDAKNARGCLMLGAKYNAGSGVRQNVEMAKKLYRKACNLGEKLGCVSYKKYGGKF